MKKRHRPSFVDFDFQPQAAFLRDKRPLIAALCTRRSGKSYGAGLKLFKAAYYTPGCSCLYIALTRDSAKKIMWKDVFKVIDKQENLGCRFNENELTIKLPNESIIYCLGADSSDEERKKLLGQKYKCIVIDEAASYTIDLYDLVYNVLKPTVADYRGQIILIGTPSNLRKGFYYGLTQGQDPGKAGQWYINGWSCHRWSAFDNPYMRDNWRKEIEDLKAANPLIVETPGFKQHYLGQWCINESALVYRFDPTKNLFHNLPLLEKRGRWHFVLGVDLGYNDPSAFTLGAYHDEDDVLYVLSCFSKPKMDVTEVAERIRYIQFQVQHDYEADLDTMIIDGSNKQAVEEMRRRHGLALQPANKTGKSDFIELMNGDFIMGRIKLHDSMCQDLTTEYSGLIWDERSVKREEHPACPNHCCDATLYMWRRCYQYLSTKPSSPVRAGSDQWYAEEVARMEKVELERLEEEKAMERELFS